MLFQPKKVNVCECSARKGSKCTDTYNYIYSNTSELTNLDILLILEYKEDDVKMKRFENMCKSYFKDKKFAIIIGLNCVPNDKKSDVIGGYKKCKHFHVKKKIEELNPKIIIPVGRAIYTITETKELKSHHFFVPVNESIEEYQIDDTYFYSPEFNSKVFPVPPLYHWMNNEKIKKVYEYEFMKQQFLLAKEFCDKRPERKKKITYSEVDRKDLKSFLSDFVKADLLSIDTETTGRNPFKDEIISVQLCNDGKHGYFIEFNKDDIDIWKSLFDSGKDVTMQNASFDLLFLRCKGIDNGYCTFDTMLASHQLNENSPNGLKPLTWLYTVYGGYDSELKIYVSKNKIKDYSLIPKDILLKYACYDPVVTYQIAKYFMKRFESEDVDVKNNFYDYVMPAISMIVDMQYEGVQIDMKYLFEYNETLVKKAKRLKREIYHISGKKFNINSGKQLSEVLYSLEGFVPLKDGKGNPLVTKNGDLQLGKDNLKKYSEKGFSIADKIIEYGHINKEINQLGVQKYIDSKNDNSPKSLWISEEEKEAIEEGFMQSIVDGYIHGNYNLAGTTTGRASSGKDKENENELNTGSNFGINFQNIPTKYDFRKLFLPKTNCVFGRADYDSMEVTIQSQIAGQGALESLLKDKKDMHCYTGVSLCKFKGINISYEDFFTKTKVEGKEEKKFVEIREESKVLNFQCLAKGTKIKTNKGLLNIEDIVNYKTKEYKGEIKVEDRKGYYRDISHTIYNEKSEIIDLEMDDGNIISVTPDHIMIVKRKEKEIKIEAQYLKEGDDLVKI